jgi:hypothetical protein
METFPFFGIYSDLAGVSIGYGHYIRGTLSRAPGGAGYALGARGTERR